MYDTTPDLTARPMRFLIRAEIARRMEEALATGRGGFQNHHELVNNALDSYLLDLMYPEQCGTLLVAPPGHTLGVEDRMSPSPAGTGPDERLITGLSRGGTTVVVGDVLGRTGGVPAAAADTGSDEMQITEIGRGVSIADKVSLISDEPLLGLHNRDWPSLWALRVLAEEAHAGPVGLRQFYIEATSQAWKLADRITERFPERGRTATALLPTNREKRQSAEGVFQTFAIASVAKQPKSGRFPTTGPLPAWRVAGLIPNGDKEPQIGVTDAGWDLLDRMTGLTPWAPHPESFTRAFFDHIKEHSPGELWGFRQLLRGVSQSLSRTQLVDQFAKARKWKESVAASAAQGYLARGREWGLVEPKLIDGKYRLTELGEQFAAAL